MKKKKIEISLLCNSLVIKDAVGTIQDYYKKNPQFYIYDFPIEHTGSNCNKYKILLGKASVLRLQKVGSNYWVEIEAFFNQRKNHLTLEETLGYICEKNNYTAKTKVFHQWFPNDIPLIDKNIEEAVKGTPCYQQYFNDKKGKIAEQRAIINIILCDVEKNRKILEKVCNSINKLEKVKITPLRAWDILVWSLLPPKNKKTR